MKITVSQLRRIIREEVEKNLTASSSIPLKDVHGVFRMLVDTNGEVPLEKLASELGVDPKNIDWNKTGLRVLNGVVTELIGDTPYRSDM